GATVITDTLSLIVLAGVAGSVTGESSLVSIIASLLLGLIGLGFYAGWVLPRLARWFFAGPGHEATARFLFLLAALLSAAVFSEMVGIEGIVGAFFAGLGLNRMVPAGSALMERVEFFGSALLVPVFLVSVGVLIKPSVVVQPSTLGLAAVFCAAVIGGKGIAALAARPALGFTSGESGLMFGLSLSQAAATLAATFVGFDIGLFGEQVVNAVLVVILVTLLIAALATARTTERVEPTPAEGDAALGQKLVVVAAREDRLTALAALSRALVEPDGGIVVPLRVTVRSSDVDVNRDFLALVEEVMVKAGLEVHARLRVDSDPVEAAASTAIEDGGTLLLMDWQASSRHQAALAGGRDDDLILAAPVPVVLAALSDAPVTRVVVALDRCDLEPESAADVSAAIEVARRVALASSTRQQLMVGPDEESVTELFASFGSEVDGQFSNRDDWVAHHARPGDLVVLPAHPDWSLLGPVAVQASAHADVSVLVVADPQRWTGRLAPVERSLGALVGLGGGDASATISWD
ncbi:MAG TPA: cation:proton antiporter, partial [Acidimicrobiales bacterium]